MYRNGRPIDPDLPATEKLHLRCLLEAIDQRGHIKPANIHFPDQSVNRQRFSRPRDVLLRDGSEQSKAFILWGVASILVSDLPPDDQTTGGAGSRGITYSFSAEHDPEEDNYSHTELRVYKNGQRERKSKKINSQVKKRYRTNLALQTRIVVRPLV